MVLLQSLAYICKMSRAVVSSTIISSKQLKYANMNYSVYCPLLFFWSLTAPYIKAYAGQVFSVKYLLALHSWSLECLPSWCACSPASAVLFVAV